MELLARRLHPPSDKRLLPPLARLLRRPLLRRGRFETGHPLWPSRPVALPFRLQCRHGGKQASDPLRQRCHGCFQCDNPLLLPDDHPLLALDRFVLGDDEPNQVIATGVLEINHADSIPRPLIPEQIPKRGEIGAKCDHRPALLLRPYDYLTTSPAVSVSVENHIAEVVNLTETSSATPAFGRISIWQFKPGMLDAVRPQVTMGLAPLLQRQPGFVRYVAFQTTEDRAVTYIRFASKEKERAATEATRSWVEENVEPAVESVMRYEGPVVWSIRAD